MVKIKWLLLFFVLTLNILNAQEVLRENGSWFTFTNSTKLIENVCVSNTIQMRRVSFMKDMQVFIWKPGLTYTFNKNLSVGLGYMSFKAFPNGVYHSSIKKEEERIWQHITVKSDLRKAKLNSRFIFEQRFKDVIDKEVSPNIIEGTNYVQRFRYRIQVVFHMAKLKNKKSIYARISNEIRVRFNRGLSQPDFDQNNFGAYIGYKLLDNSKVWIGYGRDYCKVNSTKFVSNDILHIAMSYDIDLTKKKS